MRFAWLLVISGVVATTAPAAPPTASPAAPARTKELVIKKRNGQVVRGQLLTELERGFLLRVASGESVVVEFKDIADVSGSALAPTAPPASQATTSTKALAAGAPPVPGKDPAEITCTPSCRAGFSCVGGACVSSCNPACRDDQVCTADFRCVDPGEEEQRVAEEQKKSHLAELAGRSSGLHWGILVNEEIGFVNWKTAVASRVAAVANYRLGKLDVRGSVGLLWVSRVEGGGVGSGTLIALDGAADALVRLTSRYGLGIGIRAGLGGTSTFTGHTGLTVWPAVFSLGHDRNLDLGISASVKAYQDRDCYSNQCYEISVLNLGGGLALSYLWY